ncbi:hypothetical protein T492DRAFT_987891 [Pavlovales sp. CCMP2436]|nr:hypothetical protein T492DRAFT_987891 [Pavlovales sp. CCMP2436]
MRSSPPRRASPPRSSLHRTFPHRCTRLPSPAQGDASARSWRTRATAKMTGESSSSARANSSCATGRTRPSVLARLSMKALTRCSDLRAGTSFRSRSRSPSSAITRAATTAPTTAAATADTRSPRHTVVSLIHHAPLLVIAVINHLYTRN